MYLIFADNTGWVIGYTIGIVVVLVVVALVVPILLLAKRIGDQAEAVNGGLEKAVDNTAALAQLRAGDPDLKHAIGTQLQPRCCSDPFLSRAGETSSVPEEAHTEPSPGCLPRCPLAPTPRPFGRSRPHSGPLPLLPCPTA